MKPIAIFINMAGPIEHEEHGKTFQVEAGVMIEGSPKPDSARFILKTDKADAAIDQACEAAKGFLKKFYPKHCSTAIMPMPVIHEPT